MRNLALACAQGRLPAQIAAVVCNNPDAPGLEHARELGLPLQVLAHRDFADRDRFDEALATHLLGVQPDLVVLAGFMRILKGEFLRAFPQRVVNIHPSLLPAFTGLEAWKQALDYGVKFTGCTVHFVDQGVDTGPIIAQQTVPVLSRDDEQTLHARIQIAERQLYPLAISALARGLVRVEGRKTVTVSQQ